MLWAGINAATEGDKLTIDEAGSLIHPGNMSEVSKKIMEVYESSMPKGDNSKGEIKGKNKNRSTG